MGKMTTHVVARPVRALRAERMAQTAPATSVREPDRREQQLAARLRARDPEVLGELYERYGTATFGYLVRTLGDRSTAEDVQQQVFAEVWRRAAQYDPARAGLMTWMLTIARSRAIDHLRRRIPEPRDPQVTAATIESGQSTADATDALADRWRMAHYLGLLPEDERRLLQMRFYEELSQSEIAERTGVALGTIKARMVRGLRRMRELIEAEEGAVA